MKTPYHPLTARKLRKALTCLPERGAYHNGLCSTIVAACGKSEPGLPAEYYRMGGLLEDTTPNYSAGQHLRCPPDITPDEFQAVRFMFGCFLALYLADLEQEARQ